ncbi:MAG: hypothetical protein H6733_16710 [Alphaproteobacteria bacterium]|nr:hypothetical protein [Alphaproteobacteria bacterium]
MSPTLATALRATLAAALGLSVTACQTGETPDDDPGCANGLDADGDGVCDRLAADWSTAASIPDGTDRRNIFDLDPDQLDEVAARGRQHALLYPIDVSGMLLPYAPIKRFFDEPSDDPQTAVLQGLAAQTVGLDALDDLFVRVGLPRYNGDDAEGIYDIPAPDVPHDGYMGATVLDTQWGEALTFSCAACHAGRLLGRSVMGLTNRRPGANAFFDLGKTVLPMVSDEAFAQFMGATPDEVAMVHRSRENLARIGVLAPQTLGLDTSLAQVAMSLARRGTDPYAERDVDAEAIPRPTPLRTEVADSKPMPWWTLRYKTRWLADGSIVQGNPIFTNFLWNEIGRGTDLHELEDWLVDNRWIADELTVAVFATDAPRWTDFFEPATIDLDAARRGQALFGDHCAACHGTYDKAWDAADAASLDDVARLATTTVHYAAATPVVDVDTDPGRYQGIPHFGDQLNALAISAWMETVVEGQVGYVPPPLDGIWARYPYLHNGSVPTLCDLLTPSEERPTLFWQGPSEDAATDFDADCVGYPIGDAVPEAWKVPEAAYDTQREGMSNVGHDAMLRDAGGSPVLSAQDRADLVTFLKTL